MDLPGIDLWLTALIQGFFAPLMPVMESISFLGTETFFLLLIPAVYWCFNPLLGLRTAAALFLSTGVNSIFKMTLASPRPYWVSPEITAGSGESTFGMPSNHAQTAAVFWCTLTAGSARALQTLALILVFLIGLSRVVLGVHFVSDVLIGWLIGMLLLVLFNRFGARIETWLRKQPLRAQLRLAALASALLVLLVSLPGLLFNGRPFPAEWTTLATASYPALEIEPYNLELAFTLGGITLGIFSGAAIYYRRYGQLLVNGLPIQLLLRYVIGLAGILLIWFGLGSLLPRDPAATAAIARFLRYALLGFWMTYIAPWLFLKFRLLNR